MDVDDIAIRLLGDVGVRMVRQVANQLDRSRMGELWQAAIALAIGEHPGTALIDWRPYAFSELLKAPLSEGGEPAVDFGRRLARYVLALPSGEAAGLVDLLLADDSAQRFSTRDAAMNQALRVVVASAEPLVRIHGPSGAATQFREIGFRLDSLTIEDPAIAYQVRDVAAAFRAADLVRPDSQWQAKSTSVWPRSQRSLSNAMANLDLLTAALYAQTDWNSSTTTPAPATETYVNVGFDEVGSPGVNGGDRPFDPGDQVNVWVGIGPRAADAVPGTEVEPIDPAYLEADAELEVVLFPDDAVEVVPQGTLGSFRVVNEGDFPVQRRSGRVESLAGSPSVHRLYARMTLPNQPGTWRLRVGVFRSGVLLQVQQVTVPVGTGATAVVRTTYELVRDFRPTEELSSLRAPTLTIYANAGDETHDFAFYLPNGDNPSISKLVHLDANRVVAMTERARRRLRKVSWGQDGELDWSVDGEEQPGTPSFVLRDGAFGTSSSVAAALIELAVEGRHLWQAFAEHIEPGREFRDAFRASMRGSGEVQLTIKSAPDLIVPLQLLYDRRLDTSAPTFLHVCEATQAWLDTREGEPPCLTAECPDSGDDHRVCVAGFWGLRHAISISPAFRRAWEPTVPTSTPPRATLARAVDRRIDPYWAAHEENLGRLMRIAPPEPASTSTAVLGSLQDDASVIAYFLAHVEYLDGVPRIVLNKANERGALNATTLEGVDLSVRRPLIFVNACASAGVSPDRLLGLVTEFMDAGASGAVGTEIAVFVDTAVAFAELMLAAYTTGVPLGEAMRRGRIQLLQQGNPLGFVYVSFGLHDLRLVRDDTLAAAVGA